jgi:hypothetical protein
MENEFKILLSIEEQISVQFTGKVNILATFNHQFLGHILFKNGEIFQVTFQQLKGLKALYTILIQEYSLQSFNYVVEPEVVEEKERQIDLPYMVIKNKMSHIVDLYRESLKFRPPENVKILIDAEFLEDSISVTSEEFEVLKTLAEWNNVYDVYQHCSLLDHEITAALVSLRKKSALKILGHRNNADDSP